ncbi:MAG: hypothetical protein ACFFDC_01045 [Promethearchaeota archaeon]
MSKETLKNIYFIIIGIAITEALNRTFEGAQDFLMVALSLIIFLPTIIRFTHGASLYLDKTYKRRKKIAINFISFSIQSLLFYIMSIFIENIIVFQILLFCMLINDAIWMLILIFKDYEEFDNEFKQWLISDGFFCFAIIISFILIWVNFNYIGLIVVLIYSTFATFWDYIKNKDTYFPQKN